MTNFTDLYFGLAAAENEATEDPKRFVQSFVDQNDSVNRIRRREKFLLLGPKGCGKSAIGEYFRLQAQDWDYLVELRDFSTFPLNEVSEVRTGESASPLRTVTAWRFLILCALFDLIL